MAKKEIKFRHKKKAGNQTLGIANSKLTIGRDQIGHTVIRRGDVQVGAIAARAILNMRNSPETVSHPAPMAAKIEQALDVGIHKINESQKRMAGYQISIDADRKETRKLLARLEKKIAAR